MLSLLAACAWLAAAEPVPPVPPPVFSNETPVALVTGEKLAEVSFVAAHCVALLRHLEFALNLPPPPPPLARLEVADIKGFGAVETQVGAGTVLVVVRLGAGREAPGRCCSPPTATKWCTAPGTRRAGIGLNIPACWAGGTAVPAVAG